MLDIVLLIVFAFAFFLGWRKGLISSFIGFIGTIVAFGVAFVTAKDVALFLGNRYGWTDTLALKISAILPMPESLAGQSADFQHLGAFYSWLENLSLPESVRNAITTSMKETIDSLSVGAYANMLDMFSKVVAEYILIGLVFLALWLILWIGIKFISKLFVGVIHHTPIIGQMDALGGALLMCVLTALVVAVIYSALEMLIEVSVLGQNNDLIEFLHQSRIMPFLKNLLFPYTLG